MARTTILIFGGCSSATASVTLIRGIGAHMIALLCGCSSALASVTVVRGGGALATSRVYGCSSGLASVTIVHGYGRALRLSFVVTSLDLLQYPYQRRRIRLEPNQPDFLPCLIVFLLVVISPFDAKYLVCTHHSLPRKLDKMVLLLGMIYLSYECK